MNATPLCFVADYERSMNGDPDILLLKTVFEIGLEAFEKLADSAAILPIYAETSEDINVEDMPNRIRRLQRLQSLLKAG